MLTAKMVDEMPPTEKGKFIAQMYRAKKKRIVEEEFGISIRNGFRYIRLTQLIPEFGQMVNEEKITFASAVALSYLNSEEQNLVYRTIVSLGTDLTPKLAKQIKKHCGELTVRLLEDLIVEELCEGIPDDGISVTLPREMCGRYFRGMNQREMSRKIDQAMKSWYKDHAVSERLLLFDRLVRKLGLSSPYVVETIS